MQENTKKSNRLLNLYSRDKIFYQLLIIVIAVFLIISVMRPDRFLSSANFLSLMAQFPQYGLMTFGVMLAMLLGGIDMSVVGIANLSAIAAAKVMTAMITEETSDTQVAGYILLGIVAALIVGAIAGWVNGAIISFFKVPAMLATIGTAQVFQGISVVITKGKSISGLPKAYSRIGNTDILKILPVPLLVFIICTLLLIFVLNRTTFGKQLYMIGTNDKSALYSGLKVKTYIQKSFILGGALAAVAGLIMMSRTNSAKADYGDSYTLQCVMIAILGGVDPAGGSGKTGSVVLAILIVQLISSAINMFPGVNNYMKTLIWGCALIGVMLWRKFSSKKTR